MTSRMKQDVEPLAALGVLTVGLGLAAAFYLLMKFNEATLFSSAGLSEQGVTGGEFAIAAGVFYYHLVLGAICIGVSALKGQLQAASVGALQPDAPSGQKSQAGARWQAGVAARQLPDDPNAAFTLNGSQFGSVPEARKDGQAFCIGCRKMAAKADLLYSQETDTYYHPACLIAAGGSERS
jgi:hypothetical protein